MHRHDTTLADLISQQAEQHRPADAKPQTATTLSRLDENLPPLRQSPQEIIRHNQLGQEISQEA